MVNKFDDNSNIEEFGEFERDYGVRIKGGGIEMTNINPEAKYKVVIEAHADEISWNVHYITPEGYIHVSRNGGTDQQIAPSKRVNIHTDNGMVKGIFGWPAIHTRGRGETLTPKLSNITIDVGAKDAEEVEKMGIEVGIPIKIRLRYS